MYSSFNKNNIFGTKSNTNYQFGTFNNDVVRQQGTNNNTTLSTQFGSSTSSTQNSNPFDNKSFATQQNQSQFASSTQNSNLFGNKNFTFGSQSTPFMFNAQIQQQQQSQSFTQPQSITQPQSPQIQTFEQDPLKTQSTSQIQTFKSEQNKDTLQSIDTIGKGTFQKKLSFNDINIVPAFTNIKSQDEISFITKLTKDTNLSLPIISFSNNIQNIIKLNLLGGLGIFKNDNLEEQIHYLTILKKHMKFIDETPITICYNLNYNQIYNTFLQHSCDYIVVTDENNLFYGIIIKDYFDLFSFNKEVTAYNIMMPLSNLKCYKTYDYDWKELLIQNPNMDIINNLKYHHYIPIIDDHNKLHGVITLNNIKSFYSNRNNSILDKKGRLLTAITTSIFSDSIDRITLLVNNGLDIIFIQIDNAYNNVLFNTIKEIKTIFPKLQVIVGNVHSTDAFISLSEIGVDAISVGNGEEFGQYSLLTECSELSKKYNVPIINNSGTPSYNNNIFKAFVAGSHSFLIENDSTFNYEIKDILNFIKIGLVSLNALDINHLHSILPSVNVISKM